MSESARALLFGGQFDVEEASRKMKFKILKRQEIVDTINIILDQDNYKQWNINLTTDDLLSPKVSNTDDQLCAPYAICLLCMIALASTAGVPAPSGSHVQWC